MSEALYKALGIIHKHAPIRPREFARFMWPDSDGWRRSSRAGPNGSMKGGGMHLAGGAYLGKLAKQGYAYCHIYKSPGLGWINEGYYLTDAGRAKLGEVRGD